MPSYELLLRGEFSAAHQLRLTDGRLEPMHGHNWEVEVFLEGERLNEIGILADFTTLQQRLGKMTAGLDGTCLNDLPALASDNPSTERVARHVHDAMAPGLEPGIRISKVRVWETRHCAAAYVPC